MNIDSGVRELDHLGYYPSLVVPHCSLILLLHGLRSAPSVDGVDLIARSFAAAGYRVLSILWNADLPLDQCCDSDGPYVSASTWNECLVRERTARAREIEESAVAALEALAARLPGQGWEDYLLGRGLRWSRVIQAGYSSGANQSAFLARLFPVAGLILLAGGGDGEGPPPVCPLLGAAKDTWDPPPASWMSSPALPSDPRHVGLTHVGENFELFDGWTLDGVPATQVDFDSRQVTTYSDLRGAARLVRSDPVVGRTPHGTAIDEGPGMDRVRMYLACKAGGLL